MSLHLPEAAAEKHERFPLFAEPDVLHRAEIKVVIPGWVYISNSDPQMRKTSAQ